MFERIRVQGFRRLRDVDLKLRPLNVLIGANGCGKTSLLDVFSLLSASARGELKKTIHDIGGIDSNLTVLRDFTEHKTDLAGFQLDRRGSGGQMVTYEISLSPQGNTYRIPVESLNADNTKTYFLPYLTRAQGEVIFQEQGNQQTPISQFALNEFESALSQAPRVGRETIAFQASLASVTHYHVLDVSSRAPVRLPQHVREAQLPGSNGEDLVACLYWMRETAPDRFETIEDTLRVAFPSFERLNFPPVAAGLLAIAWKERDVKHPFYMHQLSEGTLRFLWLVTLLYSPGLTEITLLDEPEVSLHPELLSVLADCLRDASKRTQLIVATHADRLVRFLTPEEVVILDMEDGATTATRAEDLDLGAWLSEYTLDQVWQHGRMGGRS